MRRKGGQDRLGPRSGAGARVNFTHRILLCYAELIELKRVGESVALNEFLKKVFF